MSKTSSVCGSRFAFEPIEPRVLLNASAELMDGVNASPVGSVVQPLAHAAAETTQLNGTGLTGEYFKGANFDQAVLVRTDAGVSFNWRGHRPDGLLARSPFSVRWTGDVLAKFSETYQFKTTTTDGVRLWVNGQLLIDSFTTQVHGSNTGSITLVAGQTYSIRMDYFSDGTGTPMAKLQWSSPSQKLQVIPKADLFPDPTVRLNAGLVGQYFEGGNFQQPIMSRADPLINVWWGGSTPAPALRYTPFSVRWTGTIETKFSETYTFYTVADDGVRLYVNGELLINDWLEQSATPRKNSIVLEAATPYTIKVEYFENTVPPATIKLLWSSPSTPKQVVPASAFVGLAAPVTASVASQSAGEIDLSWTASPAATGYKVLRSTDATTGFTQIASTPADVTTYADTGLAPGSTYFYQVVASNAVGDSAPSATISGSDLAPVPTGVAAQPVSSSAIDVTWAASTGATGYSIERSLDGTTGWTQVGTTSAAETSFSDEGLAASTQYFYRVSATNSAGTSSPSAPVSASTLAATSTLAAPTNLTATATSDTQISLAWNDVAGETGFNVEGSPDGLINWTPVATVGQGVTTLAVAGLTPATTYHYRVIATNAGGSSPASNVASATTAAATPAYVLPTAIYGLNQSAPLGAYLINTTTGAATLVGAIPVGTAATGRDPVSGKLYYLFVSNGHVGVATWDPAAPSASANQTLNTNLAVNPNVERAAFSPNGLFYFTAGVGALYAYNTTTNTAAALGTIKVGGADLPNADGDMAFGPDGSLYVETQGVIYQVTAAAIAAATSGSTVPATTIGSTIIGNIQIAFGEDGVLYGYNAAGQIYTVNLTTGAATAIPGSHPSGIVMGDLASEPLDADLAVTQAASTFTKGSNGTYTLTVVNNGPSATIGAIQITDTLPAGVTLVAATGNGWTFNVQGQTITLSYAGAATVNSTLPSATLTVFVANSAPSSVTNTASVSTSIFDQTTANNVSTLVTPVV